jgi:hypothetical protein
MTAWAAVWRSERRWAEATYQRHEASLALWARAFDPSCFVSPQSGWKSFQREFSEWIGADASGVVDTSQYENRLRKIDAQNSSGLWIKARDAMQLKAPPLRVEELDLRPTTRTEPQWIANRIACIATILDAARVARNRKPLFPGVHAARVNERVAQNSGSHTRLQRPAQTVQARRPVS